MMPRPDPSRTVPLPWALGLFALIWIVGLGLRPVSVPDEARYGAIASEMIERGDWVALRLGGFHWLEKPPLAIWGIAASMSAFGDNAFAIRLPSALAGLLAGVCAGWVAARATGRPNMLPLVIAVQATTVGPIVLGTVAITDGMFAGTLALTMATWFGALTSRGRQRLAWLAATGVAAGLAFLCKGFLAFAMPAVAAAAHLAMHRRWRELLLLPWLPMLVAGLVLLPWALLIHHREPRFWEFFIEYVHLKRALRPEGIHHPEPWWLYVAILPPLGLFWTLLWPKAFGGLRNCGAWRDGVLYLLAWLACPLLILSASSGKLPTYTLPLFPPLSAIVALGLLRAHETGRMRIGPAERAARMLVIAAAAIAVLFALAGTAWTPIPALWSSHAAIRWLLVAAALAAWAAIDRWSASAPDACRWLLRTATAPALALAFIPALFPDAIVRGPRNPWPLLAAAHAPLTTADTVISTSPLAHAVIWETGRRDVLVTGWPGEFDGGMQPQEDMDRLVPTERLAETIRKALAAGSGRRVALVSPERDSATEAIAALASPSQRLEHEGVLVLMWQSP